MLTWKLACGIPSLPNALLFQSKRPLYPTLEVKGNFYYYLIDLHFCLTQKNCPFTVCLFCHEKRALKSHIEDRFKWIEEVSTRMATLHP